MTPGPSLFWGVDLGMPTRKLPEKDLPPPCTHPEHHPPGMQVFAPGLYEHTCPACGWKQIFRVPATYSLKTP